MMQPVGHQIERLALMQGARTHRLHQAGQAEMLILFVETDDIGLNDLVGLAVQGAAGVPIGEEQQRRHRKGEQQHIDKNDAESLGL